MGTAKMGPLIFSMALPAMISMIINALYNIVDSIFVAKYSQDALAAVSLVYPLQMLVVAIGVGTGVGVNSLIARRLGERRQEAADLAAEHGVALSVIGGIAFFIIGWGLSGAFVGAFGAILGHNFPLYFGFKGGKGIATSFGCLLIVFPLQTLCAFGVFLLLVATTRYVSAGSLGAAVTLPFFIMFTTPCDPVIWGSVIAICLLAIWRHYPNIKRLMNHTESKLNLGKKKNA